MTTQQLDRELLQVAVAMNRVRAMYRQPWVSMTYRITCKDGLRPAQPKALGTEVLLGQGEANVCACVHKLVRLGYEGPLVMEIYAGPDRREALSRGKGFLEECLTRVER